MWCHNWQLSFPHPWAGRPDSRGEFSAGPGRASARAAKVHAPVTAALRGPVPTVAVARAGRAREGARDAHRDGQAVGVRCGDGAPRDSARRGAREAAVSTLSCLVSDADDVRSSVVSQTFEHGGVAPLAAMLRGASPDGRIDAARMLKEMAQRDRARRDTTA